MASKITVNVTVKVILHVDDGVELTKVLDEMDYNFSDTTGKATIEDTTITDNDILDSK